MTASTATGAWPPETGKRGSGETGVPTTGVADAGGGGGVGVVGIGVGVGVTVGDGVGVGVKPAMAGATPYPGQITAKVMATISRLATPHDKCPFFILHLLIFSPHPCNDCTACSPASYVDYKGTQKASQD